MTTTRPVFQAQEFLVEVTGYNSLPNQTDDSPFITATGDSVFWGGIAVSRPLLRDNLLPYGSVVTITGYPDQFFIVFDTMNKRFKNYKADIWFSDFEDAWGLGVKRNIKVTKVGKLPIKHIKMFTRLLDLGYNPIIEPLVNI